MKTSEDRGDLVAYWNILLRNGVHSVEFEHGTVTGKRVLRIDGQEIFRREWMFKLVGDERFTVGNDNVPCEIRIDPLPNFSFGYSLYVDGKSLEQFTKEQNRCLKEWITLIKGKRYKIILEKEKLDIWVNGENVETVNEFTETGTEMKFAIAETEAIIKATSAKKKEGVLHDLYVDGKIVVNEQL